MGGGSRVTRSYRARTLHLEMLPPVVYVNDDSRILQHVPIDVAEVAGMREYSPREIRHLDTPD